MVLKRIFSILVSDRKPILSGFQTVAIFLTMKKF